jgi:glucosamine--fructose-6-phosphate aminotransferase (isomerizing)
MHGPLAMVDAQVPVRAVVADGPGGRVMRAVLPRLTACGADVFTVGTLQAVADSTSGIVLPPGIPEELSPILEILPFQQLAMHLAVARGEDPDAPRGLRKMTETLEPRGTTRQPT